MNIGILDCNDAMGPYIREITQLWGLRGQRMIRADDIATLDPHDMPVLVCGAGDTANRAATAIHAYAQRGGAVIACLPSNELLEGTGLAQIGSLDTPLRLRLSGLPVAGVAGDLLPIVGTAGAYEAANLEHVLAHLSLPSADLRDWPGVMDVKVGNGRLIALAFDLPRSVQLCRQGDPTKAEVLPATRGKGDNGFRAVHMVSDIGGANASWLPYADLLARVLVELIRMAMPAPTPMLWHLPAGAPGVVLYSGDEDNAPLDNNHGQMRSVQRAGARMNLYIIPESTQSTLAHAQGYQKYHHLGPHPNLRSKDGTPIRERLDEFTRQVKLFEQMFKVKTRSVRNHCVVWVGYTDLPEEMQRLGIRMEGNYNYGSYCRTRDPGPYTGWGAAMPMRFCRTDGTLIDVRQQHTHIGDDETFCDIPSVTYSYRLTGDVYAAMARRILSDCVDRFHTPYAVNIHPSNWAKFSEPHSDALLAEATRVGAPVLSFDLWSIFCDQRDAWTISNLQWQDSTLRFTWTGQPTDLGMHGLLPLTWNGRRLETLTFNGAPARINAMRRHGQPCAMFELPAATDTIHCQAVYQ
jgi:hypothetical protein